MGLERQIPIQCYAKNLENGLNFDTIKRLMGTEISTVSLPEF